MGPDDPKPVRRQTLRLTVAFSPGAGRAIEIPIELPEPATAEDAIRASGVLASHPELARAQPAIGVWGRACARDVLLRDGDRVELYRPLTMDPNEARRLRARNLRRVRRG